MWGRSGYRGRSVGVKLCFRTWPQLQRETRIWVSLIIENLAAGVFESEIIEAYPTLTIEDIRLRSHTPLVNLT